MGINRQWCVKHTLSLFKTEEESQCDPANSVNIYFFFQKKIKDETFPKAPKNNYTTYITDVFHIDDTWSSDYLELFDFSPEKKRG